MSDDEFLAFLISCCCSFVFWGKWIRDIFFIYDRRGRYAGIAAIIAPLFSMGMLFVILKFFSSFDVRNSLLYLMFYVVMGAAWCGLMTKLFSFFGLDCRHDVAEQDNYAADVAISGAVLGTMLCFAGANIGDGPGWWVVIFCAGISTGALFLVWLFLDRVSGVCEAITVDRDLATGIRFAGMMIATGFVFGRSVAGNWVSSDATWLDFLKMALPWLLLIGIAIVVDLFLRLSKDVPRRDPLTAGILPALFYCAVAMYYVLALGAW